MKPIDSDPERKLRQCISSKKNSLFRMAAAIGMGMAGVFLFFNFVQILTVDGDDHAFVYALGFCSWAVFGFSCATLNLYKGAALCEHGTVYRYRCGGNIGKAILLTAGLSSGTLLAFMVERSPLLYVAALAAFTAQLAPLVIALTAKVKVTLVSELRFLQTNRLRGRTYHAFETGHERFAVRSDLLTGDRRDIAALVDVH